MQKRILYSETALNRLCFIAVNSLYRTPYLGTKFPLYSGNRSIADTFFENQWCLLLQGSTVYINFRNCISTLEYYTSAIYDKGNISIAIVISFEFRCVIQVISFKGECTKLLYKSLSLTDYN